MHQTGRVAPGTPDSKHPLLGERTVKDAEANLTTYEYDGFDRLSKTRFPVTTKGANQSSTTDYEQVLAYDANSNATSRRNRAGEVIGLAYDNLNRVTAKDLPPAEPDVTYAYDNLGRLTSASQTGNALSFTYDALSRNLTQAGPQGTVTSQWDLAGRRTKLTWPGSGLYVDYDYLVTGDMTKIRENGATSGVGVLATYAFDDLGRRTGATFGNGVTQAFAFDPVSRLATLTNDLAGTTNDLSATFAYNPASQITSNTRTGDAYAWTGHFNENKAGTANGLNQLTQYGAKSLSHDAKGNVTAFGSKSFTYSSENLLLTGPNSSSLAYDPAMRLHQIASGASTTRFADDGLDRIAEYDGSNALLRRYVHGPGVDEPIVWYEGSGTTDRRFLSADERGSIISVTDGAGNLLGLNRYDEYGQPQSTNLGKWGYTGQAWLPEVGAWYYKARVYDPEVRFLQPDPIGYEGGMNLYAYVENDPVNWIDPLGLVGDIVVTGRRGCSGEMFTDCHNANDVWFVPDFSHGFPRIDFDLREFAGEIVVRAKRRKRNRTGSVLDLLDRPWNPKCGTGPRIKISPIGFGLTGFLFIGGFSGGVEGGISIPVSALQGNFRGTQLYASASISQLIGLGAFVGGGMNFGGGYTRGPIRTGTSISPVLQGGAAVQAGGEVQVELGSSPGVSGGGGPRVGYGAYLAGGVKRSATAATPELCY